VTVNARPLSVLLRSALAGDRPQASPALIRALQEVDDEFALADLAARHRVASWLATLIDSAPALAGDPRFQPVRQAAGHEAVHAMLMLGELRRLLRTLNERDIPAVVLKGPVLGERVYPEPSLRPFGDIDLLIHEINLETVAGLLRERGYVDKNEPDQHNGRLHHCHGLFQRIMRHPESGAIIEIHCDHLQIGLEPVSMDEIWARSEPIAFGNQCARSLATPDLFVQLCVHLHRHGFERLIWFKDLDLLVRRGVVDWDAVCARARQEGCTESVAYTLWLLERVLHTPLPSAARDLVVSQGRVSRAMYRVLWPPKDVVGLVPRRQWRWRRVVQFAPETGLLRGGLPSLVLPGRRRDKLAVLAASARATLRRTRGVTP